VMILKNIGGKIVLCHESVDDKSSTVDNKITHDINYVSDTENNNHENYKINKKLSLQEIFPFFKKYLKQISLHVIIGQLQTLNKECTEDLIVKIFNENDIISLINHFNFFLVELSKSSSKEQEEDEKYHEIVLSKKEKKSVQTLVNKLKNIQSHHVINVREFYKMFNFADKLNINRYDTISIVVDYMNTFYDDMIKSYNICGIIELLCKSELSFEYLHELVRRVMFNETDE